jgi:pheromone shutdown protein TraB
VLGDRPIEITLERAWNALPWRRRLRLLGDLLLASLVPQAEVRLVLTAYQMLAGDVGGCCGVF